MNATEQLTIIKEDQQEDQQEDRREDRKEFVKQIHRFTFSEGFTKELYDFSRLHQNDKRCDFKEAWVIWVKANEISIEAENIRLDNLGYYGDSIDKMYKSSRYYFRNKPTAQTEPKKRRKYVSCDHELLMAMDLHISKQYNDNTFTPASGYDLFCETNKKVLNDEIKKMIENKITDTEFISNKIKKTYKNRYFLFIKNNS